MKHFNERHSTALMLELVAELGEVVLLCELFDLVSTHTPCGWGGGCSCQQAEPGQGEAGGVSDLLHLAGGEGPRQKLLRHILARFLGLHCTLFHQVSKEINWFPFWCSAWRVPGGTTLFEFSDNWCRAEAYSWAQRRDRRMMRPARRNIAGENIVWCYHRL